MLAWPPRLAFVECPFSWPEDWINRCWAGDLDRFIMGLAETLVLEAPGFLPSWKVKCSDVLKQSQLGASRPKSITNTCLVICDARKRSSWAVFQIALLATEGLRLDYK